jgi:hypothetical protein
MLDAKEELDGKLRLAINAFTTTTSNDIAACISSAAAGKEIDIRVAAGKFREEAEKVLPSVQEKTEEYIADARTTDILVNAVMVTPIKLLICRKMR